jgi:hypothetical protein
MREGFRSKVLQIGGPRTLNCPKTLSIFNLTLEFGLGALKELQYICYSFLIVPI